MRTALGISMALCLLLAGCGVESEFDVVASDLPPGLAADPRLQGVTVSRVEIVFYTNDPVAVTIYDSAGRKCLVEEGAWRWAEDHKDHTRFYVTFNSVERLYERSAPGKLRDISEN